MLKEVFEILLAKYSNDPEVIKSLWNAIEKNHNAKNRYYHNLSHLEHLYQNLIKVKDKIQDWDIILVALFYHDYVYNTLKKDNEEQSTKKAKEILQSLSINKDRTSNCEKIILATKGHNTSTNNDINYFIDADLSILGSNWGDYKTYFENVRKEYKYYPNFMYNKGRIKVLRHFLGMSRIFKTDYFYQKYEAQAKDNLLHEINLLSR